MCQTTPLSAWLHQEVLLTSSNFSYLMGRKSTPGMVLRTNNLNLNCLQVNILTTCAVNFLHKSKLSILRLKLNNVILVQQFFQEY